jgi:hypothetical protein
MKQYIKLLIALPLLLLPVLLQAHGVSDADQEILSEGGLLAYIYVGAKHMVTGYDHLLFPGRCHLLSEWFQRYCPVHHSIYHRT